MGSFCVFLVWDTRVGSLFGSMAAFRGGTAALLNSGMTDLSFAIGVDQAIRGDVVVILWAADPALGTVGSHPPESGRTQRNR